MESKGNALPLVGLRPILTVASQAEFAEALRERRLQLGLTLSELDHKAGFHEGYAAHLERPFTRTGRRSFNITPMGGIWMEVLKTRLALLPF